MKMLDNLKAFCNISFGKHYIAINTVRRKLSVSGHEDRSPDQEEEI